jgi:hypothetical protein
MQNPPAWYAQLAALYPDDKAGRRALQELDFARLYDQHFSHGTDGHSRLVLIAMLATLLDQKEAQRAH